MLEARLATGFFEEPNDDPGLVIGQDGIVRVVEVGGVRVALPGQAGGGGGNVQIVSVPIAHDTPGILTDGAGGGGINLLAAGGVQVGDLLLLPPELASVSIDTAWNGSTPSGWIYGASPYNNGGIPQVAAPANLTQVNPPWDANDTNGSLVQASQWQTVAGWVRVANLLTPLRFVVDDGAGGNPGSTRGAGAVTYARVRGVAV